jgi:exo-1,4-beta-D-glucosaminidase
MKRLFLLSLIVAAGLRAQASSKLLLNTGWRLQPSFDVKEKPEALAKAGFGMRGWYRATVPSTVMAALVANNVYADPYFGMNLRSVPGTTYPIGTNFSNVPMPPASPFRSSWWYRTEFTPPAGFGGRRLQLHFDGINFRANVWVNGRQIASAEKMAGAWRRFEFDVTGLVAPGAPNALAVEVFPPTPEDLAITFVDWNPSPPDKAMGIWRDVYITATGPVAIRFPQVITTVDKPALDKAHLKVTAELKNVTDAPVEGLLGAAIEDIEISTPVRLRAGETQVVTLAPDKYPQLNVSNPRLWWPVFYGAQNLHTLKLKFETSGAISDSAETRFGIREITSELDEQKHLVFKVNGKNILIRGAGYSFDMLLRQSPDRQAAELNYVRDMNLNTVRLEGKMEDENFLRLTDEYGILVMAGWCCCDHWEKWSNWDDEDRVVAAESLRDQIRRLRTHASVFDWMNGSDGPPPPDVEKMYIGILKELNWPNPYQSSATAKPTTVTGPTGVKMTGPYEYVAPSYWLTDTTRGGAHGFNTETSPGPAVPPIESLRKMLPEDHLWPIDSYWDYHAGGGAFRNIKVFTEALNARYGPSSSAEEYAMKAQVMAYEGERAMFEAFGAKKYTATGVIQWMLNNAWPSMIWHLYDYYLRPGGSYFGAKKGCEPLHIQYSYDDGSIVVVNSRNENFRGLRASARIYNLDLAEKFTRDATVDIAADGTQKLFAIPKLSDLSDTWFLKLSLQDGEGRIVSSNFYWLSNKPEVLDWERSTWFYTPTKSFADLTALNGLPQVDLKLASTAVADGTSVTVENPSKTLAFAVHLKVMRSSRGPERGSEEILPVLWEDNYFALMPGEKRQVLAKYRSTGKPIIEVDGWNVVRKAI